ncbi:MAG: Hsp20/alpha crystallin family protein [Bacillota bacterium]|nr:Hsp20/alpha crystallin family protein [Bacillota bacterium]
MFSLTPYNRKNNDLSKREDPWGIRSVFDSFFDDSFFPAFFSVGNSMKADIRETEKEYILDVELPGVKKEDIRLELRDGVLTVGIENNEEINEEKDRYIRKERRYGSYSRSFQVDNVRNEDVSAKYNDGILTVTLPKSQTENPRGHSIEIN